MTKLLVSVRSLAEARVAVDGGADFIDVKEPHKGSLGPCAAETINDIVDSISSINPVTAACGELVSVDRDFVAELPKALLAAKLGLSGCSPFADWRKEWEQVYSLLHPAVKRVAVAYADWQDCDAPSPMEVVEVGADLGASFFLIDTYYKRRTLLDIADSDSRVAEQVQLSITKATDLNLQTVIAGSVSLAAMTQVCDRWKADVLAVRGAACVASREGDIDGKLVADLRKTISNLIVTSEN